ncbi:MAG: hypothetical protein HYV04_15750 [Deltaproteobacteria bacterium]|nr:hypothetical protein [Deltaproteobacteria bacterium]
MQGSAVSKEDEATLREIIRSIDKELDYSLSDGSDAETPNLTLRLARHGWEGTMRLGLNDLRTAKTDLAGRHKIRQKIKRLREHMWDNNFIKDVLGTKAASMLKESGQGEDSFKRTFMRRSPRR